MKYWNTMAEESEKNIYNLHYVRGCEEYNVFGWIYWNKNIPVVYNTQKMNTEEIKFIFERMNHGLWEYIEENILRQNVGAHESEIIWTYDFVKLKCFIVKWLLKNWNLPIELVRKPSGELTEECFDRVMSIHPNIMRYFLNEYENTMFMSEEDRGVIARQSTLLFHPKSKGVANPHSAISMYCNLSSFWEKFGLNYFEMQRLPHDIFIQLKTVLGNENTIKSREIDNANKQTNKANSRRR